MKSTHRASARLFKPITTLGILLTLISFYGCNTQKALLTNSLKATHRAVTPVIQTAPWAKSWWMDRHNAILERNKTEKTDLIFIGNSIIHHWEDTGKKSWNEYFGNTIL